MRLLKPWNITTDSFIRLLDFIEKNGLKTVGFEDDENNNPQRSLVITFDDCPKHLWDFAIPELIRRKMKAVFCIPTAYINGYDEWNRKLNGPPQLIMDETDLRRLLDLGMEIGSHNHHHILLEEESEEKVVEEIEASIQVLKNITCKQPLCLAYPFGSIPVDYKRIMKNAGLHYGLGVSTYWEHRYSLSRWEFFNDMTEKDIAEKIQEEYRRKRRLNNSLYVLWLRAYYKAYDVYAATFRKLIRSK